MSNDDLVTTSQAAAILGRSRYALYRLMKSGHLTPAMKTPAETGTYLFDRAHVLALAGVKPNAGDDEGANRAA